MLVKLPVPLPSVVIPWLLVIVGFCVVLHTTPRTVTAKPPSEVILPPLIAVVAVILVTELVVNTGKPSCVVKDCSSP